MKNELKGLIGIISLFKWAFSIVWEIDKKTLLIYCFVTLIGAMIPVVFLNLNKIIVDKIAALSSGGQVFYEILGYIGVFVTFLYFKKIYEMLPSILFFTMKNKYGIGLQRKLIDTMQRVPLKYFNDSEFSTRIDRMESNGESVAQIVLSVFPLIGTFITITTLMITAIQSSMILFALALFLLIITIPNGIVQAKKDHARWLGEGTSSKKSKYYSDLPMLHPHAKEFRLLQMDDFARKNWFEASEDMRRNRIKRTNEQQLSWQIFDWISKAFQIAILVLGVKLIQQGSLTIGGLTMFVGLFQQLSGSSIAVGSNVMSMYTILQQLEYQRDFIEFEYDNEYPLTGIGKKKVPESEAPVFELDNVSFGYTTDKLVLKNITMKIQQGETIALVGGNGAGKSTLVNLLLGLYAPTVGDIYYKGKHYSEITPAEFVNDMGVSFQDFARFELRIRENIAFGDISKIDDDAALIHAGEKSGALQIINRVRDGLDTYLGRWYKSSSSNLSGGEWQRLVVSRAHISNRNIMILDEPASMLDPIAELEQFNHIRDTAGKRTSILISHRIGFARMADKIAVIDDGRLLEFGPHDELMEKKGLYYEMFTTQASWYVKEKSG